MTSHIPRCVAPLLLFLLFSSLAAAQSAVDLGDSNVSPVFMTNAPRVRAERMEETRNQRFQEFVAAGTRFYENAEFAKALTWYERAQRLEPDNPSLKDWSESARRNLEQQTNLRQAFSSPADLTKAVKERYRRACDLFEKREYEKARAEFWQVWLLAGNFESTRDYLTRIGQAGANGTAIPTASESAYSSSQCEIRLAQGKELLDAQRYDLAVALFNQVLACDPQNPKALKYLAKAEKGVQRAKEAQEQEQARAEEERAWQEASRVQEEQRKTEKEKQTQIENLLAQAEAALGESRFDEAGQTYNKVLALDAGNRKGQRGLAALAEMRAQTEAMRVEAERKAEQERAQAEQKAAERRIDEILAQADALFKQQNYEEALQTYQEARAASPPEGAERAWRPRVSRAANGIAECQDRIESAKREAELAEQERAENERRLAAQREKDAKQKEIDEAIARAKDLLDKGACEESVEAYQVAAALAPGDRRVSRGLNDAQKAIARAQETRAFEQAVARQEQIDGALAQAAALAEAGEFDKAVETYQSVLEQDPANRKAQRGIANVEKDRTRAEASAQKAEREEQRRVAELQAEQERQKREAAIQENIKAGDVLLENGRCDKAIEFYQAALTLDSRNKAVQARIEKARNAQREESRAQLADVLRQSAVLSAPDSEEDVADIVVAQADGAETAAPDTAQQPAPEAATPPAAAEQPADQEDDEDSGLAPSVPVAPAEDDEETEPAEATPAAAAEEPPQSPSLSEALETSEKPETAAMPETPETAAMPEMAVVPAAPSEEETLAEPAEAAAPAVPVSEETEAAVPAMPGAEENETPAPAAEETAVEDAGKDAATLTQEASASMEQGDWEEAVRKLKRALELEPENRKAERLLKKANREMERTVAAKSLETGSEVDDLMRRAQAKYRAKNLAEAREVWNQVLALDPENKAAKTMLEETEAEHQRMLADEEARRKAAEAQRASREKLQTPIPLIRTAESLPLREFLQTLSLASEVDFTVTEGSDTQINGSFVDKTLEEILDSVLLPIGLKWEIQKGDIIVVSPDLKTRLFRLTEEQLTKVQALLDSKAIQRMLWPPAGEKPLKGTLLQLEPRQRVLIAQDSQQNIDKLDAFLKDLSLEQPTELVTRVYQIDPALGQEIKGLVDAIIQTEKTPFDLERGVWIAEDKNLIVKDTVARLEQVEKMLEDKGFVKSLLDQRLELGNFDLILRDVLSADTELAQSFALQTKEVIETLLYAEEGMAAAKAAGRRMWFDPSTLHLTITDTRENIERVAAFLESLPQMKKEERKKIIFLKHVVSSDMKSYIEDIYDLVAGAPGTAPGAEGETVTKSLRTEQEITYRDLFIRLIRVNENAPEDDMDDSCEMIVRTSTQRLNVSLSKYDSTFVEDYEILADDVRATGETGKGTVTLKIRYIPAATGELGRPGLGAPAVAPTPTPVPAVGPMKPILKEFGPLNAMVVRYEDPNSLKTVEDLVREFDKPTPQVNIATKFVQVNEQRAKELSSQFLFTDLSDPRLNAASLLFDANGAPIGTMVMNEVPAIGNTFSGGFGNDWDELRSAMDPPIENPYLGSNLLKGTLAVDFVLGRFLGQQVESQLRMLEAEGIINIVNGPHIVVMDNETANFEISRDIQRGDSIANESLPDGMSQVVMMVSPEVTSLNSILLTLDVEIADFESVVADTQYEYGEDARNDLKDRSGIASLWRRSFVPRLGYMDGTGAISPDGSLAAITSGSPPSLSMNRQRKWVQTKARIKDGGTIVLGGWTGEYSQDLTSGVPGLRNLPWLGKLLFSRAQSSTYKTTLLIFLSGKIIE